MMCPRLGWVFMLYASLCVVDISHGDEIINGKKVVPHSMPFMAFVHGEQMCGGTLISKNWVLTAAHCTNMTTVRLGSHNVRLKERFRQVRNVKRNIPHPGYDNVKNYNDFMLIELDKPVQETKEVQILKLSKHVVYPAAGSTCEVAGWGKTSYKGNTSNVLLSARVTVINISMCNSYSYYNHNPIITHGQICAGSHGTNIGDSCQGDSGGPLLCSGQLVGVTSFGFDCGRVDKPGVYGFLSTAKLDWIKRTTGIRDI